MSKPNTSIQSQFTFGKAEHLCRQSLIELLYAQQQVVYVHPFRITYLKLPELPAPEWVRVQVMFPVPKKKYKLAVKRNRTRRITRELYRLNKESLILSLKDRPFKLILSIAYTDNTDIDFHKHGKFMKKALQKLEDLLGNYV